MSTMILNGSGKLENRVIFNASQVEDYPHHVGPVLTDPDLFQNLIIYDVRFAPQPGTYFGTKKVEIEARRIVQHEALVAGFAVHVDGDPGIVAGRPVADAAHRSDAIRAGFRFFAFGLKFTCGLSHRLSSESRFPRLGFSVAGDWLQLATFCSASECAGWFCSPRAETGRV